MKYTRELLEKILEEGGATLIGDYIKYNQRLNIIFRCKCGNETSKRFEILNIHRCPYCRECSKVIHSERYKKTCLEKYGVSNASKNEETINKIQETFKEKYGCHPKQSAEVQEKWRATCLAKYGGHPNQNSEIQAKAEKNAFQYKNYKLPSGKIVKIQGYEDKALDELLEKFIEDEIYIGKGIVPRIPYICKEGKNRIYFPDFFIEPINTILEIKSEWTIKLNTCRLEEKAKAVLSEGYKYEVWIYDNHKKTKGILTF